MVFGRGKRSTFPYSSGLFTRHWNGMSSFWRLVIIRCTRCCHDDNLSVSVRTRVVELAPVAMTHAWIVPDYSDVIMSSMASQITRSRWFTQPFIQGVDQRKKSKLRVTGLCAGNSPMTGEFPTQRPVTQKMFPFDDVTMSQCDLQWLGLLPGSPRE